MIRHAQDGLLNANDRALMKAKAAQFEVKLSDNQMMDILAQNERFFETDDHKELAALRVEIQGIRLQMQIKAELQQIEADDFQ